jgi:hypothetical protein
MIDEGNKEFAEELIKKYGEDRFYHSCIRTSGPEHTVITYMILNELSGGMDDAEACRSFFTGIGLGSKVKPQLLPFLKHMAQQYEARQNMCRIAFGFCRFWKEFGLRTHVLPDHLHARMLLDEPNEWVRNYAQLLEKFPDW